MRHYSLTSSLLFAVCWGLSNFSQAQTAQPEGASGYVEKPGWATRKFAVAAANPLAADAGYQVLKAGGSALDAAIAVQMVLALVEPQSSGIGGGAFLLHWDGKQVEAYDGRETAPAAADSRLFLTSAGKPMVINFKGITSINSCGIRTWVNFLKDLQGTEITYEECPPLIVRQMNMVPSFLGHAKVSSIFVPYVCESCEAEKMILVTADKFGNGNPTIPESMKCESCKTGEMELDGNPKQYFAFAK